MRKSSVRGMLSPVKKFQVFKMKKTAIAGGFSKFGFGFCYRAASM
jgi:hypothetical protein